MTNTAAPQSNGKRRNHPFMLVVGVLFVVLTVGTAYLAFNSAALSSDTVKQKFWESQFDEKLGVEKVRVSNSEQSGSTVELKVNSYVDSGKLETILTTLLNNRSSDPSSRAGAEFFSVTLKECSQDTRCSSFGFSKDNFTQETVNEALTAYELIKDSGPEKNTRVLFQAKPDNGSVETEPGKVSIHFEDFQLQEWLDVARASSSSLKEYNVSLNTWSDEAVSVELYPDETSENLFQLSAEENISNTFDGYDRFYAVDSLIGLVPNDCEIVSNHNREIVLSCSEEDFDNVNTAELVKLQEVFSNVTFEQNFSEENTAL